MKKGITKALAVGTTVLAMTQANMVQAADDAHFTHHALGVFAGERKADHESEMIYGVEYEYRINKHWGVGLSYEDSQDAHHGDGVDAILGMAYLHPWKGLRIGVGVGEESVGGYHPHDETVYRLGVGYEFHVTHNFGVGVAYNRDFVNSDHVDVYGVSLVLMF